MEPFGLDDELKGGSVDDLIGASTDPSVKKDARAAADSLDDLLAGSAASPSLNIGEPPSDFEHKPGRQTKAELQEENAKLKDRLNVLEARTDTDSIAELGTVIAFGIQIAGSFAAAQRGPHWNFAEEEAKPLGQAWAIVAAPYAEKLKQYIPWGIALAVTWQSVKPRLDYDSMLKAEEQEAIKKRNAEE